MQQENQATGTLSVDGERRNREGCRRNGRDAASPSGGRIPSPTTKVLGRCVPPVQFVMFCVVGASGVIVDMLALFLFADERCFGLNLTLSKICAAEAAIISNFTWNELWTFRKRIPLHAKYRGGTRDPRDSSKSLLFSRFVTFNALCGAGVLFAVFLLHLFNTGLGVNVYLSNLVAIGLVTAWNYWMNARFNWRVVGVRLETHAPPALQD